MFMRKYLMTWITMTIAIAGFCVWPTLLAPEALAQELPPNPYAIEGDLPANPYTARVEPRAAPYFIQNDLPANPYSPSATDDASSGSCSASQVSARVTRELHRRLGTAYVRSEHYVRELNRGFQERPYFRAILGKYRANPADAASIDALQRLLILGRPPRFLQTQNSLICPGWTRSTLRLGDLICTDMATGRSLKPVRATTSVVMSLRGVEPALVANGDTRVEVCTEVLGALPLDLDGERREARMQGTQACVLHDFATGRTARFPLNILPQQTQIDHQPWNEFIASLLSPECAPAPQTATIAAAGRRHHRWRARQNQARQDRWWHERQIQARRIHRWRTRQQAKGQVFRPQGALSGSVAQPVM